MQFDLQRVLNTAGPTASLIFASWILLSVLQERYSSAHDHFRELATELRTNPLVGSLHANGEEQLRLYKRRCHLLHAAITTALIAAIFLITTIITGTVYLVLPQLAVLKYVSVGCSVIGLLLVIGAAVVVLAENTLVRRVLDREVSDIPALASR
jgi:hypothetical protein